MKVAAKLGRAPAGGAGAHSRGPPRSSSGRRVTSSARRVAFSSGPPAGPVLSLVRPPSCAPRRAEVALRPRGVAGSAPALPAPAAPRPPGGEGAGKGDPLPVHRRTPAFPESPKRAPSFPLGKGLTEQPALAVFPRTLTQSQPQLPRL